jgi:hypothetical protein
MPTSASTLKLFRQVHLYIGIFIAPAILFFAFTGVLQTFNLHESGHGRENYTPPMWVVKLSRLHKDQTIVIPQRKAQPAGDRPAKARKEPFVAPDSAVPPTKVSTADAPKPSTPPPTPPPPQKTHLPMKIFFLLVSLGLFSSTLTGIYMAYKYNRNKLVVTGLLVAGIVVPLLLLPF